MEVSQHEYEIRPKKKFSFGIGELLEFRELLYFFIWRDVKVKYKQTFFGIAWVVFQPLLLMLVFTFVLGARFQQDLGSVPYGVFVLSGLLLWNVFSSALSNAGNSMVTNANIIKKIYFPRLIIPISSVAVAFIDFTVAIFIYIIALFWMQAAIEPSGILWVIPSLLLTFSAAMGMGSFIAAWNVKYRDFRYILPFFIQALMFLSPVFYPLCHGCSWVSKLFALNPMYAPIELFRMHLSGTTMEWSLITISICTNICWLFAGLFTFRKMENYFADLA
jgi:lipopolysaccharide transport system permease protein